MKSISAIALLCLVQGYTICIKGDVLFDAAELEEKESSPEHEEIRNLDPSPNYFPDNWHLPDTEDDMQLMLADEGFESNVVDNPIAYPKADSTTTEETSTTVSHTSESVTEQVSGTTTPSVSPSSSSTTTETFTTTTSQENVDNDVIPSSSSTTETFTTTTSQENVDNDETESTTTMPSTTEIISDAVEEVSSTTEDSFQTSTDATQQNNREIALRKVHKLSDQIRLVLQQYKKTKTVKILDVPIPDPMSIPDMSNRYSLGTINFKDMKVYGLSNFTVKHINTDLEKMQVYVMLKMERLVVIGNYSMRSWISRAAGPFTTVMLNVTTEGAAELQRNDAGELEASESDMDMTFEDVKLDFKNLGLMGSFFQGVMGSVASFLFDGMKPVILGEVNTNLRSDVNKKLKSLATSLKMADMNPVDQAVMEGRRYVREQGYDPYFLKNYTRDFGLFTLNVTNFHLRGLSRFYRVGEIPFSMDSGVIEAGLHVATNRLNGSCVWSVGIGHTPIREGSADFSTDHLQIRGIVRQSLDLSEQPKLHDLDILLGRLELKTARIDTLDFIVERAINHLPSLLRHIIVDGLEDPIKYKVQQILDEVDVQAIVNDTLPEIDKFGV